MNEDFVSFDLAKKLKGKGYQQTEKNALAMYDEDGEWYSLSPTLDDFYYVFNDFDENDCVCPTISQVLKWLREEKKIYLELIVVDAEYMCNIYKIEPRPVEWVGSIGFSEIYEAAAIAGIEYVIDNLI